MMVNLEVACEKILTFYRVLGGKKKPRKDKIWWKLCIDGREINSKKQIAIAFVPVNLVFIFKSQDISSVFYIDLLYTSESKETLLEYLQTLSIELKTISSALTNQNYHFVYVSNMHNCGLIFYDDFCLYYHATDVTQFSANL